ncbi:MAG: ATP-binding cassette domain-containing protein [Rhodospirillales bacterium]
MSSNATDDILIFDTDDILIFDNVVLQFGAETIYDGLSFTVKRGEFLCILGPSGCGKSTSLRLMGNCLIDRRHFPGEGSPR